MVLIYSPDAANVNASRGWDFERMGMVSGVESCKIVFLDGHFLFTCSETSAVRCIV